MRIICRNQSYSFPGDLPPTNSGNRGSSQGSTLIQGSTVSFPVISSFPTNQPSYIIPQDLGQLQNLNAVDNNVQLYTSLTANTQQSQDYLVRRPPQKPCKRPRRFSCHFLGCDRSFDSQWALER